MPFIAISQLKPQLPEDPDQPAGDPRGERRAPRSPGPGSQAAVELRISGMHCASCVATVERALGTVPGVAEASVNLATERALVHLGAPVPAERLVAAVRSAGYQARVVEGLGPDTVEHRERAAEQEDLRRRLVVAAILAVPVVVLGNAGMLPPFRGLDERAQAWIQLVCATPVQWWAGWPFVRGSWNSVRRRSADMNLLIGVGTLSATFYSVVATIA